MKIKKNLNVIISSLTNSSVHDSSSSEYQEYRRCWKDNPAQFIVRDFPLHLDIEITNRCNLKCTFCDRQPFLKKEQIGDMDMALYKKILDEGGEKGLWGVKLSYRGETLLNKHVDEMVAYAKAKGVIDIYFNTNGMLLTEETAKKLIDAGLDRISISIEGIDANAYENERRGASFDRVLKNVETLINLREKLGSGHPRVRVQTVRLPRIDLDAYMNFWSSRCDEVAAIDFKAIPSEASACALEKWACSHLWQRMTIQWDGTIMPCNDDNYQLLSPGSVRDKSVEECWLDPKVKRARDLHKRGESHLVKACTVCPWRASQVSKYRDCND